MAATAVVAYSVAAKSKYVKVRCDPLEQRVLGERAKAAGMNLSDWIRSLWARPSDAPKEQSPPVATVALCERCQRIGVPSCAQCRHTFFGEPLSDLSADKTMNS